MYKPLDAGVDSAVSELDKLTAQNTGTAGANKAMEAGNIAAQGEGANAGQTAAATASGAGATKGAAENIGQNAANQAVLNNIEGKTQTAANAQQEEIKNAQKKVQEAEAERAEKAQNIENISSGVGTVAGTALGSLGGPVGAMVGGAAGGLVGKGIGLGVNKLFSDERLKIIEERAGYHSKIKNPRLLHLLDEIKEEL